MPSVVLRGPADFAGWRQAARGLVAKGVPPSEVIWQTDRAEADLFGGRGGETPAGDPGFTVPRAFVDLAAHAALHRAPERFALLYRLLWRLRREPRLMDMAADADVARIGLLARNVRRDIHKMHAPSSASAPFARATSNAISPGTSPITMSSPPRRRSSRAVSPRCAGRS